MSESRSLDIKKYAVDTNVILRFLLGDVQEQSIKAKNIFESAKDGFLEVIIPEPVFQEVVFVLTKVYKMPKAEVITALTLFLDLPGVQTVMPKNVILKAFAFFGQKNNIPWGDALIAATTINAGLSEIYSFDDHFDSFDGLTRVKP